MFQYTQFALVILSGLMQANTAATIDTSLRFNDLDTCLAAKAKLESEAMPEIPRDRIWAFIEFHCVGEVS